MEVTDASAEPRMDWVVLTTGSRPSEFRRAVDSIIAQSESARPVVVGNGVDVSGELDEGADSAFVLLERNVGIPAGRNIGFETATTDIVGFLDDDAELEPDVSRIVRQAFEREPDLGAVAIRLVDENGATTRRHVPRPGAGTASVGGEVVYFVGAAHAVRSVAFKGVDGYFDDLWYGHEEIELCWRLIDAGWKIRYLAEAQAFHPRTSISRHADGWTMTGRNRVRIARRTLPWPMAIVHVFTWLGLGLVRAPHGCRRAYIRGWSAGWRDRVRHEPIRWATVWRLTRLGRPPVI